MIKIKIKNRSLKKDEPIKVKPAEVDIYKEACRYIQIKNKHK